MSRAAIPTLGAPPASQHLAGDTLVAELRAALSDLGVVESVEARARARRLSPGAAVEELTRSLSSRGASLNTIRAYAYAARTFLTSVRKSPDAISLLDIERYLEACRTERGLSIASVNFHVHAIRRLFLALGLKTASPIHAPRRPAPLPRFLNEGEVRQLLQASAGDVRTCAIVSVLVYTGIRVSELCGLDVQDLDLENGELLVRSGKGGKDRLVILDPAASTAVKRYLRGRCAGALFPVSTVTVERAVREAAARAALPGRVTPHLLRHTLATALLRRGCDIRFIQQQLGHSSVATTQMYAHVDLAGLRTAFSRARPSFEPGGAEKR